MILLVAFAFLAGIVTILSPCILPILPIILSSSVDTTGRNRPVGVIAGFVFSFTFFTLFLSTIVRLSNISADTLRSVSVLVVAGFGMALLVPEFQSVTERLFSRLTGFVATGKKRAGFGGGFLVGISIGLLWTPCVGPILASVISLAITGTVTGEAFLITFAYALGTAIPMLLIMLGGQNLLRRIPRLTANLNMIQKVFGLLMIATAVGIFFNIDRKFQTAILDIFPKYGTGLTKIEDNELVRKQLDKISTNTVDENDMGKPVFNMNESRGTRAPEIIPGGIWFNSDPLTLEKLRGKVVIIDFWTYSCINCQRTLPYLQNWHEKYKDKGLVIIGVHSPEFEFEKDGKNLQRAIGEFGLTYPVVQDNNFSTWNAYRNRYWPAKYFVDKDGYVRFQHFGEGAYDESEKIIQELLKETGAENVPIQTDNPNYKINAKTHETYLGYGRIDNFGSVERIKQNAVGTYTLPKDLSNDQVAYVGRWLVTEEYANPKAGASLLLSFDAKEVFLVMRAVEGRAKVKVFVDNEMQYFGEDNTEGTVVVESDRLYKLINLPVPGRHLLRLEFEDDNTQIFAFTFG